MTLTPEHRAHWNNHIRHLRDFWEGPHPDNPTEPDALEELAEIAVADHLVALEAQVAEARRLIAQYVTPFDPQRGATDCLSCGGDVSTGMFEDFWTPHAEDCPVGAFLAATAPHGAGEAMG